MSMLAPSTELENSTNNNTRFSPNYTFRKRRLTPGISTTEFYKMEVIRMANGIDLLNTNLNEFRKESKQDNESLRRDFKQDISVFKQEIKQDISELKQDNISFRQDIKETINKLGEKIDNISKATNEINMNLSTTAATVTSLKVGKDTSGNRWFEVWLVLGTGAFVALITAIINHFIK